MTRRPPVRAAARGLLVNEKATPPMRTWRAVEDLELVRDRAPDWIVWNELGRWARYRRALRRVFPDELYVHVFADQRGIITLSRARFRVVQERSRTVSRGLAGVNPARRCSSVLVEDLVLGAEFAILGTQWPNGAWNRRHLATRRWRREAWRAAYAGTQDEQLAYYATGISSVGAGDLNRRDVPEFHPEQRWLHDGPRILKTWVLEAPGGVRFTEVETWTIPDGQLHTDKPGLGVDVVLTTEEGSR